MTKTFSLVFAFALLLFIPNSFALEKQTASQVTPHISEFSLPNGLTLIVLENHLAPVISMQIWYKVGSRLELPGYTGISHALEHMMFEGSKNFPGDTFKEKITELGGSFNAETNYDYTSYFEEAKSDKLAALMGLEADRMANLTLSSEAFSKEIHVVKEERRMRAENNPQALLLEQFMNTALPGSPYAHPIVGWMRDLNQMTIVDLTQWYKQWYVPNNAALVIAGDVQPEQAKLLAEKFFGNIPAKALPEKKQFNSVPDLTERKVKLHFPAELPWLILGYNVPSLRTAANPKDAYTLEMITAILNQGQSSRLTQALIREKNVASNVGADYSLLSRWPTLFIFAGTPNPHHTIKQLQEAIAQQILLLKTKLVPQAELNKAQIGLEASYIFSQDSLNGQANLIGHLWSVGLPLDLANNYVQKLDEVTPQDIQNVARKYFVASKLTIGKLKPLAHSSDKNSNTPHSSPSSSGILSTGTIS